MRLAVSPRRGRLRGGGSSVSEEVTDDPEALHSVGQACCRTGLCDLDLGERLLFDVSYAHRRRALADGSLRAVNTELES